MAKLVRVPTFQHTGVVKVVGSNPAVVCFALGPQVCLYTERKLAPQNEDRDRLAILTSCQHSYLSVFKSQ